MQYEVTPKLGKILKERVITQQQLAQMTGITQASISRFDRNKQHMDLHLVLISKALNLNIEDLFDISETKKNDAE